MPSSDGPTVVVIGAGRKAPGAFDRQNLDSALFTVRAVLTASLAREESRGSLQRRDYPQTDDEAWRRNSRLEYDRVTERLEISHRPVDDP